MDHDSFTELTKLIAQLRDKDNGCPWDLEQTHATLAKYLEEETDEVLEVLETFEPGSETPDYDGLKDELGDVLLQVMLHSQIANEEGHFDIDDVIANLTDKLIRRHPHVFGESDATTIEDVEKQWEQIKADEKRRKES